MDELSAGLLLQGAAGSYTLERALGEGGFGLTWRARDEAGRAVVVKQLRLERAQNWKSVELFEREAQVMASLDHPNIPRLLDRMNGGDGALYLVQELVPGQPLSIPRTFDREQMVRWFTDILGVLDYLHSRIPPVLHRDINPKNIMLRPDGSACLIDFGAVQAALRSASHVASTSVGTFGYMAPEQIMGRAEPRSDLFALGIAFICVSTGLTPEALTLNGSRVDVRASLRGQDTPTALLRLLEAMTSLDVNQRPKSAAAALEELSPKPPRALARATPPAPVKRPAAQALLINHSTAPTWRALVAVVAIEAPSLALGTAILLQGPNRLIPQLLAAHAAPLAILFIGRLIRPGELRPARAAALLNALLVTPLLLHAAAAANTLSVLHGVAYLVSLLPTTLALLAIRGRASDQRPVMWVAALADLVALTFYSSWLGLAPAQLPKAVVSWCALKLICAPLLSSAMSAPKDVRQDNSALALGALGLLLVTAPFILMSAPSTVYVPLVGAGMCGALIQQAALVLSRAR